MIKSILPGQTIGVFGGGQLGRMFCFAAKRLGYRVHIFAPEEDAPAGQIGDCQVQGEYLDLDAVREFARGVDVVTFEFENIPVVATSIAAEEGLVRPSGVILHTTQNRAREKSFLRSIGLPVVNFELTSNLDQAKAIVERLGGSVVIKTADWGYDGKGQRVVRSLDQLPAAWSSLPPGEKVIEELIELESELSYVVARSVTGDAELYGPFGNRHTNHILDTTVLPAELPPEVAELGTEITRTVAEQLGLVGVLCVEFFLSKSGKLMINELAPRPHNSGHLTIDACLVSQFEQQVRAVCNLPLGSSRQHSPAAMANLLGDLWIPNEPNWHALRQYPEAILHLYGKGPRIEAGDSSKSTASRDFATPGRKLGHLTALGSSVQEALNYVTSARNSLKV